MCALRAYINLNLKLIISFRVLTINSLNRKRGNLLSSLRLKLLQVRLFTGQACALLEIFGWIKARLEICQVLRLQDLNVLELQCVMLANHYQNIQSRFRLLKVCLCVKLESSNCRKLLINFYKARSIKNQSQSIKARADCFSTEFSNSAQAHMTCRFLCFALSIKGKTLAMFIGR